MTALKTTGNLRHTVYWQMGLFALAALLAALRPTQALLLHLIPVLCSGIQLRHYLNSRAWEVSVASHAHILLSALAIGVVGSRVESSAWAWALATTTLCYVEYRLQQRRGPLVNWQGDA